MNNIKKIKIKKEGTTLTFTHIKASLDWRTYRQQTAPIGVSHKKDSWHLSGTFTDKDLYILQIKSKQIIPPSLPSVYAGHFASLVVTASQASVQKLCFLPLSLALFQVTKLHLKYANISSFLNYPCSPVLYQHLV